MKINNEPDHLYTNWIAFGSFKIFGVIFRTIFWVLFLFPISIKANENLLENQIKLAKQLRQTKPDSAILIFNKCINSSQKEKLWKVYAKAHLNLGILYAEKGNFEMAISLADTAAKHFIRLNDLSPLASAQNLQANLLMQTGKNEAALEKFLSCISLAERMKNDRILIMACSNVSMLYLNVNNYSKALEYGRKQNSLALKSDSRDEIAYSCASIIDIFSQTHQPDSMEKYVRMMKWASEGSQDPNLAFMLANETGAFLNAKNQYKKAIPYFLKAAKLSKEMNDNQSFIQSNLNAGLAYIRSDQFKEGIIILKSALKAANEIGNRQTEREAAKYLADASFKSGDFKSAYSYQLHYQAISDEILNKQSQESIQKLEAKYQAEKNEAAIRLLNKDNALKTSQMEQRKDERNLVILASLAILGFGLFFGNRLMARRKIATEKQLLANRLRLSADLHDDVGATLSSISIYTEAIKNKLKNNEPEKVMELVSKIGENSRETISNLGDIVWNINPMNDTAEKLFNRMESTATLLFSAQNILLQFEADKRLFDFDFSLEAKQNLYLIFKETVNNAAKYAAASEIKIFIRKKDNTLEMNISDNGIGFDSEQIYEGNGLRNIRQRTESLLGKVLLTSSPAGTITQIWLPLTTLGKE